MSGSSERPGAISWFELPAGDFARAVGFYETVLGVTLRREEMGGAKLAVFPYQPPGTGGAVILRDALRPGADGALVYLACPDGLAASMARVVPAGGRLLGPKVDLPQGMGSFVLALDTEGNRIGLHAL